MNAFITPEPHPDTIQLARKLIDEIQSGGKSSSKTSKLPPVPAFKECSNIRKPTVAEIFGSSDSESVLGFDYRNVGGGDSDSFEEEAAQPEDLYSGDLIRRKELSQIQKLRKVVFNAIWTRDKMFLQSGYVWDVGMFLSATQSGREKSITTVFRCITQSRRYKYCKDSVSESRNWKKLIDKCILILKQICIFFVDNKKP